MFISNKYTTWYWAIVRRAQARQVKPSGEIHHAIPISLGGHKSKSNLAYPTYKEQFICHLLLTKMTAGKERTKMCFALKRMAYGSKNNHNRYKLTSIMFDIVKRRFAEARRGFQHTEESKKKTSVSMQGNSNKRGKLHSSEAKLKMSVSMSGRRTLRRDGRFIRAKPQDVEKFMAAGWL